MLFFRAPIEEPLDRRTPGELSLDRFFFIDGLFDSSPDLRELDPLGRPDALTVGPVVFARRILLGVAFEDPDLGSLPAPAGRPFVLTRLAPSSERRFRCCRPRPLSSARRFCVVRRALPREFAFLESTLFCSAFCAAFFAARALADVMPVSEFERRARLFVGASLRGVFTAELELDGFVADREFAVGRDGGNADADFRRAFLAVFRGVLGLERVTDFPRRGPVRSLLLRRDEVRLWIIGSGPFVLMSVVRVGIAFVGVGGSEGVAGCRRRLTLWRFISLSKKELPWR